jgi:hypothetical protein
MNRRTQRALSLLPVLMLGLHLGTSQAQEAPPSDQHFSTLRPYTLPGRSEPEAPTRVARVVQTQGDVRLWEAEDQEADSAQRNRVLASGDRLITGRGGRAELRIGSTELRLGELSELQVQRLDEDTIRLVLQRGQLAVRVRSADIAREVELLTGEATIRPERAGHYRIDREGATSFATAWRGSLSVAGEGQSFRVGSGQRVEMWRAGGLRYNAAPPVADAFSDWVARDEQADANPRSAETQRYVSPEMTGIEDLDRHGRWDRHPEFGPVWFPSVVATGWAPFRDGRWVWRARWGWTWVDAAPWGFAPFHYGRWVSWGGRWAWAPGEVVARPVFAPALVAWVGGPVGSRAQVGFSISFGGTYSPAVGWVPLAPWEAYTPAFPCPPRYVTVVNRPHLPPPGRQPVRTGPIMYNNQGVAGAVTVVPRNALSQGQQVAAVAVSNRDAEVMRAVQAERFSSGAAPQRLVVVPQASIAAPAGTTTVAVQPVPGGAVPAGTVPRAAHAVPSGMPPNAQTAPGTAAGVIGVPSQPPAAGRAEWMQREKERSERAARPVEQEREPTREPEREPRSRIPVQPLPSQASPAPASSLQTPAGVTQVPVRPAQTVQPLQPAQAAQTMPTAPPMQRTPQLLPGREAPPPAVPQAARELPRETLREAKPAPAAAKANEPQPPREHKRDQRDQRTQQVM